MTTSPDLEQLARGLSEAQRRFVSGASNFLPHPGGSDLIRKGVVLPDFDEDLWTPLGEALRDHLRKKS